MNETQKKQFINLTYFLGKVLGKQYEVVFHVIDQDGGHIAAIANNHISGRSVNAPLTAFVGELIQKKAYLDKDFLSHYKALVNKTKIVKGSTFFIKNDQELVGILCINHDTSEIQNAIAKIVELEQIGDCLENTFFKQETKSCDTYQNGSIETLSHSIEEILAESIDLTFLNSGYSLSVQQKDEIITNLYKKGIFNIKGSIPKVAKLLHTSEPSIYRYLRKLK